MLMKGLLGGREGLGTGLEKIGMGASDLGLGEGDPVTSPSKWKPQPDWQAGRRDPS